MYKNELSENRKAMLFYQILNDIYVLDFWIMKIYHIE